MLAKLSALADQLKKIWSFLALLVGLGTLYGTFVTKLNTAQEQITDLKSDLRGVKTSMDGRFDKAHGVVEARFTTTDQAMLGLRDAVQRLVVLEEVRSVRRPYRVASGHVGSAGAMSYGPGVGVGAARAPTHEDRVRVAEEELQMALRRPAVQKLRPSSLGGF